MIILTMKKSKHSNKPTTLDKLLGQKSPEPLNYLFAILWGGLYMMTAPYRHYFLNTKMAETNRYQSFEQVY